MNLIRTKLLNLKQRLQNQKMYSVTLTLLAIFLGFGLFQTYRINQIRQKLDSHYNRSFFDTVNYVQNVESLLFKSLITNTSSKTAETLKETWRQSNLAQENLGLLPISQPILSNTSKFLTQVSDLSSALSKQSTEGKPISNKQYQVLSELKDYSTKLKDQLFILENEVTNGRIRWGEISEKGPVLFSKASNQIPLKQFENIDSTFKEFPTLIYDGPFSDHITSSKPLGLTGKIFTEKEARKKAQDFIDTESIESITFLEKNKNNSINSFTYEVTFKDKPKEDTVSVAITEKGGHPLWMIRTKKIEEAKLSIKDAKQRAKAFLEKKGFTGMVDTYYLKQDNTATINYAFSTENVIMYPDLIKVKVSLDTGDIIGFESNGYLFAHHMRSIPTPQISMEEALYVMNPRLEITHKRLAYIPTEFKSEVFVYEFKGKLDDQPFIVYVNAQTGEEEDVLILLENEDGVLTL